MYTGTTGSDLDSVRNIGNIGNSVLQSLASGFISICQDCNGTDFWRSVYGNSHCRNCCPPIDPSQVADPPSQQLTTRLDSGSPAAASPSVDDVGTVAQFEPAPRGIDWPAAVIDLAWPEGFMPEWVTHRVEVRHERRSTGRDSYRSLTSWIRPSWILCPDPAWPMPPPGRRWAPNDLSACWFCGFTLFWKDMHGDEVCGICSPPVTSGHVAGWFLKPGPALVV